MYKLFSKIYPHFFREKIKKLLAYSDVQIREDEFTGYMFFSSLGIALLVSVLLYLFTTLRFELLIFLAIFIVAQVAFYMLIVFRADKKAKFVETILPDCLQLTASNLRAGFTTERAFLLSARPEFGSFSDELTLLGKKIASGKTIESAMLDITQRIKSEKFSKTVLLIIDGIKSGGELASLLSQTAQNLRNEEIVEAKIRASVFMYFIFIFTAICFAAPILFGLSSYLVEIITKQLALMEMPAGIATPIVISKPTITPEFVIYFILAILTVVCLFGSFALGSINKGEAKTGLKYFPILLGCSLGLFFLVRVIMKGVFSFFL